MNAIEIEQNLLTEKGQHVYAVWLRPAKTKKSCTAIITKRTKVYVRAGIDFAKLSSVKNGIEAGTRDKVGELPWGTWREGHFPFIIDHNGIEYVRLYPASFENIKPSVQWFIDGQLTTFEFVKEWLLASEMPKDEKPECFTIKAENIIEIAEK